MSPDLTDLADLTPHTLLRITGAGALVTDAGELPAWAAQSVARAPWVVVRRVPVRDSLIPVGVRGELRAQRFATWLPTAAIRECVTPRALASVGAWKASPRHACVPALQALDGVAAIMRTHGLEHQWGPTGSVGFELASGWPTATQGSDLDLALHLDRPWLVTNARSLHSALGALPVRTDLLVEMPHGAVALADYARMQGTFVLRTIRGPRLVADLWSDGESIAAA
jgi:phosphoribosyl-dephospho-CoA transferase